MIPVKVQCGCGQRYAFDVEPVGGRMPAAVACPVCGTDGTAAANEVIARSLAAQPAPAPVAAMRVPTATVPPAPARPVAAAPGAPVAAQRTPAPRDGGTEEWGPGGEGDTWKWWYYIVAGVCIAGYDLWQVYDTGRLKYLGGLFLAALCIAIGVWDFQRKKRRRMGG